MSTAEQISQASLPIALDTLQDNLVEYLENGARLGWLIDPKPKRIYVYRPELPVECLENPESISGDPVLPRFVLNMKGVW